MAEPTAFDESLESLLGQLRASGARITTARRAVLGALLASAGAHPTTEQIADVVNRDHPDIHLSTVYRTVDHLADAGIVVHVRLGDGTSSVHLAGQHHHHAVCGECGRVIELPHDTFEAVTRRLREEFAFHAAPLHLTIGGVCDECADERNHSTADRPRSR